MAKQEREVQFLPKNFDVIKKELTKVQNIFMAKSKVVVQEENYEERIPKIEEIPIESKALFWVLMQEFYKHLNNIEGDICTDLKTYVDESGNKDIILDKYGIKVTFDEEAQWFYKEDMTKKDWENFDKKCNKEYLEKRNK
jgi:hypothetical protein